MAVDGVRATTAQIGSDAFVVSVSGELDIATAGRLGEELERTSERGARRVIVGLVGVTFIDSVALGVLTEQARRLPGHGGMCIVVPQDPCVLGAFEISGLDPIFRIERSLAEAVEEVISGPVG